MSDKDAQVDAIKAFMFKTQESADLYKGILIVCDLALQIEMSKVMSASTLGEARIQFQKLREEAKKHMS